MGKAHPEAHPLPAVLQCEVGSAEMMGLGFLKGVAQIFIFGAIGAILLVMWVGFIALSVGLARQWGWL